MSHERDALSAPSGIITLLTDFGLGDPFVGVMKAVMLGQHPAARFIDLTHGIAPQDVTAAAFWLEKSRHYVPDGAVFLVVVDPGVGGARRALSARVGRHWFVAPDNGVLGGVLSLPGALVVELPIPDTASTTFHGRDVFAPAAARLASRVPLAALGQPITDWLPASATLAAGQSGRVITVDHFGNALTSLEPNADRPWSAVRCQGIVVPRHLTYGEVPNGQPLCLLNSWGCVEIAVSGGSAASRLGITPGDTVELVP